MAGETIQVSEDQVRRILDWEEDHFGDVKAKAVTPAKMSESVSAWRTPMAGNYGSGSPNILALRCERGAAFGE